MVIRLTENVNRCRIRLSSFQRGEGQACLTRHGLHKAEDVAFLPGEGHVLAFPALYISEMVAFAICER